MGWACAPTVIYNAFRLQKRAKKSHKDYTGQPFGQPAVCLSRSRSTDDSENNSPVLFCQDEDMQYQIEMMESRGPVGPCPCGCPGTIPHDGRDSIKMKTKETLNRPGTETAERLYGVEMLHHQGRIHCLDEIAPLWKKDCRMWFWKSTDKTKRTVPAKEQRCT